MELSDAIALMAVAITVGSIIAGAVWVVSKVTTTVDSLKEAMNRLTAAVDRLDECFDEHHIRIDRLEQRAKDCPNRPHIEWPEREHPPDEPE